MLTTMVIVKIDDPDACHFCLPNHGSKFESRLFRRRICKVTSSILYCVFIRLMLSSMNHLPLLSFFGCQTRNVEKLQSCAKIIGKIAQAKKSCNYKWNINGIYNEKLCYNCLQQLLTLRLREFERKEMKCSNYSLVPSPLSKN